MIGKTHPLPHTLWLTGASSGIGAALARQLLAAGCHVIVTARSLSGLQPLVDAWPDQCRVLIADLADPDVTESLRQDMAALTDHLDGVIINAGTCEYLDVQAFDARLFEPVMALNIGGAARTLDIALPLLRHSRLRHSKLHRSRQRSLIVGVSSMAVVLPMPRSQAYGASKSAFEYLFNSLRVDMAKEPVDITLVRPGFVKTPLTERNDFAMPFLLEPEQAAGYIIRGMRRRRWLVQFPPALVALMTLISWLPLRWQVGLLKKLSRNQTA